MRKSGLPLPPHAAGAEVCAALPGLVVQAAYVQAAQGLSFVHGRDLVSLVFQLLARTPEGLIPVAVSWCY